MREAMNRLRFLVCVTTLLGVISLIITIYLGQKLNGEITSLVIGSSGSIRRQRVNAVNCKALFDGGDKNEVEKSVNVSETNGRHIITNKEYLSMTKYCLTFISLREYVTDPLTDTERDFPIAYSILMYTNVEQTERLLRAIYRPQNIYCIHVDKKTADESFNAMKGIADCFNNVFLTDQRFDVRWGEMTVLEPEITCMRQLWNSAVKWKYFINLTGQEFPLRTNYELVQILQAYKGANDVEASKNSVFEGRWKAAGPAPHDIVPVKGAVHVVLSRAFINFILHDQRSLDFWQWTNKTVIPDETYFNSLNHNPFLEAPGSYKGDPKNYSINEKPFLARFKIWDIPPNRIGTCAGRVIHHICIFGSGDLPHLASRKELFANKFHLGHQHAFECMEELIYNRTRDLRLGKITFDASWYGEMDFVKNKISI